MKNLFYLCHINTVGGIEQFLLDLCEKFKDRDITVVYKSGDDKQIQRLKRFVRVERFTGQRIECDRAFYNYRADIKDYVDAKEHILILHGDYKWLVENKFVPKNDPIFSMKFDKYYAVSPIVAENWKELTGKDCEVCYAPLMIRPHKKILRLVYCGRMSPEKGYDSILRKFLNALDDYNVDYLLYVFSDNALPYESDKIIHLGMRLDAGQLLNKQNFDFLIVPSKTEGCCYSLMQALGNGLPAIITPCPSFQVLGYDNPENSIILDFDCSNAKEVIDIMLNGDFDFSFEFKKDLWSKMLVKGESTYECKLTQVQIIQTYLDVDLNRKVQRGETLTVDLDRADILVNKKIAKYIV